MKVIIQAGGAGTRMDELTRNRPKGLIPVQYRPILFHLFNKWRGEAFIVIADYKFDVIDSYLSTFASDVNYVLLKAERKGNAAALKEAVALIPEHEPFIIIWSDLIVADSFEIPPVEPGCTVGVVSFPCSWSLMDGRLVREPHAGKNVAGLYVFSDRSFLEGMPEEGSFTRWLARAGIPLHELRLDAADVGTHAAYDRLNSTENRCRPYNRIAMAGDSVVKTALMDEAQKLIDREVRWYGKVASYGFTAIPTLYAEAPLTMQRIRGDNIFHASLSDSEKRATIDRLVTALDTLHRYDSIPADAWDIYREYFAKTLERLRSIQDVLPFASEETILINGTPCLNLLRNPHILRKAVMDNLLTETFVPIHGDCTLTNTLIDEAGEIFFIDARGYFGKSEVLGDEYYDWVKLYYSINANFDQFNIKNFSLAIEHDGVFYEIHSGGWEHLTDYFLSKIPNADISRIKLIHAIVWLSLASHAWEDYDSMCLAFYNGTALFHEWRKEFGDGRK